MHLLFFYLINLLYISVTLCLRSSPPNSPLSLPLPHLFLSFQKREASLWYQPALAYQITEGLGPSSYIEARQIERDSKAGNVVIVRNGPFPPLEECHMKTKPHNYYICAQVLVKSHACSLVGNSVSMSPSGPKLIDYIVFSWCPSSLWLLQSFSPLF